MGAFLSFLYPPPPLSDATVGRSLGRSVCWAAVGSFDSLLGFRVISLPEWQTERRHGNLREERRLQYSRGDVHPEGLFSTAVPAPRLASWAWFWNLGPLSLSPLCPPTNQKRRMVNPVLPLAIARWLPPRCVGIGARGRGGRLFRAHFRGQVRRALAQTRARGKSQGLKSLDGGAEHKPEKPCKQLSKSACLV